MSFELPGDCLESLLCNSCKNLLSVPPILCDKNTKVYYCGRCFNDENENESLNRVTIFETLAKAFFFPCAYQKYGCTHNYNFQSGKEHERSCKFRAIKCPFYMIEKCQWCDIKSKINRHLSEAHPKHKIDLNKFKIKTTHDDYKLIKYDIISERTFLLKMASVRSEEKCFIKICHIGDPPETATMSYDISIRKKALDTGRQIEIKEQSMENYSTSIVDITTMEKIDTQALEKFFNTKAVWFSIKISENNMVVGKKPSEVNDLKILSEMECPICQEFMLRKIFICTYGHSICEGCRSKLQHCPSCKSKFSTARNYSLESLAKNMVYPCKNETCFFVGDAEEILNHQRLCTVNSRSRYS